MTRRSRYKSPRRQRQSERQAWVKDLEPREGRELEIVAQRLRALSYGSTGQDKRKLLNHFDRDNTGELDFREFTSAIRKGGKMTKRVMPDEELRKLFHSLDRDSGGTISIDELATFVWGDESWGARSPSAVAASPSRTPFSARHRRKLQLKMGGSFDQEPQSSDEDFDADSSRECQWYARFVYCLCNCRRSMCR